MTPQTKQMPGDNQPVNLHIGKGKQQAANSTENLSIERKDGKLNIDAERREVRNEERELTPKRGRKRE